MQGQLGKFNNVVSDGRRPLSHPSDDSSLAPGNLPDESDNYTRISPTDGVAHNVAMRLKCSDKVLNGDLGSLWMDLVGEFYLIELGYGLLLPYKLQYMRKFVSKDVHSFYIDRLNDYARNLEQAVKIIEEEYNSPVRQTQVKNCLNCMRVSDFLTEKADDSMDQARVYKLILKIVRQVPISERVDAHLIETRKSSEIGADWYR